MRPAHNTRMAQRSCADIRRALVAVVVISQTLATATCAYVWIVVVGGSTIPILVAMVAMVLLCLAIDLWLWRVLAPSASPDMVTLLQGLRWPGAAAMIPWTWVLLSTLSQLSTDAITILSFVLFVMIAINVVWWSLVAPPDSDPDKPAAWWAFGWGALVLGPLVVGWAVASAAIPLGREDRLTIKSWVRANSGATARKCAPWTVKDRPIRIAVTLSGGGYRAAVTHSGVLAALDEQCVPIDLLSTVSGGSIVGASYVLGVPPREFAARLAGQKPGLPDDRLTVVNSLKSTSQVYVDHLRRVFFGDRRLVDLPESPPLLLNVTDLRSTRTMFAREVLTQERLDPGEEAERLAEVVAASSAFPGPFQPIALTLGSPDHPRYMVDGGVVENLGLEGLRRYLTKVDFGNWPDHRPTLLVISDASGYGGDGDRVMINPAAQEMLLRANAIQFDTLHQLLLRELTGIDELPVSIASQFPWRQYYTVGYPARFAPEGYLNKRTNPKPQSADEINAEFPPELKLTTILIPITATDTHFMLEKRLPCTTPWGDTTAEVQQRVSNVPTLNELGPRQVHEAFWLGYMLGSMYGQAIVCAKRDLEGNACPESPPPPAVRCPRDLRELLPSLSQ
jgi:hypothetical protein